MDDDIESPDNMDLNEDDEGSETELKEITDEYFQEIMTVANANIKFLQSEQQFALAEDIQKVIVMCNILKMNVGDERDTIKRMQLDIAAAQGKVAAALKISQNDQDTIALLKDEISTAWKQRDAAQVREQSVQEEMFMLKARLDVLEEESKKTAQKESSDDLGVGLAKHKEGLLRERDRLNAETEELNRRLKIQRLYTDEIEKRRMESENKIKELYKLLDDTSSEAFKEKRLMDQLQQQLADMTNEKIKVSDEATHFKAEADQLQSALTKLEGKAGTLKSSLAHKSKLYALTSAKLTKANTDLETITTLRDNMKITLDQNTNILKLKESECKKLLKENSEHLKIRDIMQKKLQATEMAKSQLTQEVIKLKNLIVTFEKERDANQKAFEKAKQFTDAVIREREIVQKELQKANRIIGEQADVIMLHEQRVRILESDIKTYISIQQQMRLQISQVEKERDRKEEELQIVVDKNDQLQDDLLDKMKQIASLKENVVELKAKLNQVKLLFEQARTERNQFQRDLHATIEDRDDIKERLRISMTQVGQLKEDVVTKEMELVHANKIIDNLEKEKLSLKVDIQNLTELLQKTRLELKEKKFENENLYRTLTDDEMKLVKLRKQLDNIQNEKDLIGSQMVRRNDEISLLNDKLNILQMALDRGAAQYNNRLDDVRLLKIEIANLRSQRNLLTRGLANTADMRQEVLQLHRNLLQERVRAKALEQEMVTPMNVHRWRKLSGKDPDKLDLILKIHSLQKRILHQTVVVTDRENALQESQKYYESLKQFMLKMPNHDVKVKLNTTQRVLTAKNKKLKSLSAEINSIEIDIKMKDATFQEIQKALLHTKQELIEEKKERQRLQTALKKIQMKYHSFMGPVMNQ